MGMDGNNGVLIVQGLVFLSYIVPVGVGIIHVFFSVGNDIRSNISIGYVKVRGVHVYEANRIGVQNFIPEISDGGGVVRFNRIFRDTGADVINGISILLDLPNTKAVNGIGDGGKGVHTRVDIGIEVGVVATANDIEADGRDKEDGNVDDIGDKGGDCGLGHKEVAENIDTDIGLSLNVRTNIGDIRKRTKNEVL